LIFYKILGPLLDTLVGVWGSAWVVNALFEETGAEKDPTGTIDRAIALLLSAVAVYVIGYIVTRPLTLAIIRLFGKLIILRLNFFPLKFFHSFFLEVEDEVPLEIEAELERIEEQFEPGQAFFIPHNHDGSGPSDCTYCNHPNRKKAVWLPAGMELVFYIGLQPWHLDVDGTKHWFIGYRAFKPSFPSYFQGEPKMCFFSPGTIQVDKSLSGKIHQFFVSAGIKAVNPVITGKLWTRKEFDELLGNFDPKEFGIEDPEEHKD